MVLTVNKTPPSWRAFLVSTAIFILFVASVGEAAGFPAALGRDSNNVGYPLQLKNIYVSHGDLDPHFNPEILEYDLRLSGRTDQVAITPEIFRDRREYAGSESNRPRIEVSSSALPFVLHHAPMEVTATALKRQVALPDDGSQVDILVKVVNPNDTGDSQSYTVRVTQPSGPLAVLRSIAILDDNGNHLRVDPIPSQDTDVYTAYVPPQMKSMTMKADCASNWMTIDGQSVTPLQSHAIARDINRHVQVVEIVCGSRGFPWGDALRRAFYLKIVPEFTSENIMPPRIFVEGAGEYCEMTHGVLKCPDPKTSHRDARVIATLDPMIKYTIQSPDRVVDVRLLNQIPTVPFRYTTELVVRAEAGSRSKEWPVEFAAPIGGWWLRSLGALLAFLLAVLLSSMICILGLTSMLGIGLPFGVTEIASTLTLLLQYFCFSSALRGGSSLLSYMTQDIKWVTLFWPIPLNFAFLQGSTDVAVEDIPAALIGNVKDIRNAYGCVFWASVVLCATILIHCAVMMKFIVFEREYTFPHRVNFGGLEARCIHWLLFPVTTGCSMVLMSRDATWASKSIAAATIAAIALWIFISLAMVHRAVKERTAVWVWNASLREDGFGGDTSGYWSDAICDQLNTEPANRSILSIFQWKWTSTVADIDAVCVAPATLNRYDDSESESLAYSEALQSLRHDKVFANDQPYPMAKNPKSVEVYRARSPGFCCPGQRLMVGLFRAQWLETIMTYHSLTTIHSEATRNGDDLFVPLTVKTNQLQGPVTGGAYAFFFDGVRLPFVKLADSMVRVGLGVGVGIALACKDYRVDSAMFFLIAVLSACAAAYCAFYKPFGRAVENWLHCATFTAISWCSLSFMAYAMQARHPSTFADIFLWITAVIALIVAAYSCTVTFSLFAAVLCPPLEESKFIERLSNCAVCVSDHSEGWVVEMPGYSQIPNHNLQCATIAPDPKSPTHVSIQSTVDEPTLEFSLGEIKTACRTGALRAPIVCMYAASSQDPLGYAHVNCYDSDRAARKMTEFLLSDPLTRDYAHDVTKMMARQISIAGHRDQSILTVSVIPPERLVRAAPKALPPSNSQVPYSAASSSSQSSVSTYDTYTASMSSSHHSSATSTRRQKKVRSTRSSNPGSSSMTSSY